MAGLDAELERLIEPLRAEPARAAVFCDVDGTLAPIVDRTEDAEVPAPTREALDELTRRYALVGFVSGRRVADAIRLVGVERAAYIGNHGFERTEAAWAAIELDPAVSQHALRAGALVRGWDRRELEQLGMRLEDKGPIWAIHWRGAADEVAAEAKARELAAQAEQRGLVPRSGRKVLEVWPPVKIDKGVAVERLLSEHPEVSRVLYVGDDRTDADACARLEALRAGGRLEVAVRVAVASSEQPEELRAATNAEVDGPEGVLGLLRALTP